eukprot:TRINITY_DN5322_c0_g1_i1.p1 TRINITY_DN5322_c0_g1~~TRINITY_DN5322_c0_g1_i1.p1  ORF type:complete len:498 (+),score=87.21 TRINITY_DN5322_c0_g1_i1:40-1533(+)
MGRESALSSAYVIGTPRVDRGVELPAIKNTAVVSQNFPAETKAPAALRPAPPHSPYRTPGAATRQRFAEFTSAGQTGDAENVHYACLQIQFEEQRDRLILVAQEETVRAVLADKEEDEVACILRDGVPRRSAGSTKSILPRPPLEVRSPLKTPRSLPSLDPVKAIEATVIEEAARRKVIQREWDDGFNDLRFRSEENIAMRRIRLEDKERIMFGEQEQRMRGAILAAATDEHTKLLHFVFPMSKDLAKVLKCEFQYAAQVLWLEEELGWTFVVRSAATDRLDAWKRELASTVSREEKDREMLENTALIVRREILGYHIDGLRKIAAETVQRSYRCHAARQTRISKGVEMQRRLEEEYRKKIEQSENDSFALLNFRAQQSRLHIAAFETKVALDIVVTAEAAARRNLVREAWFEGTALCERKLLETAYIGFLELHDLLSHVELMQRLQLLGQFGDVIGEQLAEELTTEMDQIIELESHNRPAGLQLLIDEKRHHFGRQ